MLGTVYYYRNRFYDAGSGRFLSEDPLGFRSSESNLYQYVSSAPTMFTDATGRDRVADTFIDVGFDLICGGLGAATGLVATPFAGVATGIACHLAATWAMDSANGITGHYCWRNWVGLSLNFVDLPVGIGPAIGLTLSYAREPSWPVSGYGTPGNPGYVDPDIDDF